MEKETVKHYSNGEVTIVWKPEVCIHSTLCWKKETGLPSVFNPREKPWIRTEGADSEKIIEHVKKCPSGALSYFVNDKTKIVTPGAESVEIKVAMVQNGPLLVYGNVLVTDTGGHTITSNNVTAFCRCGKSGNKPFCDGSHVKHNFEG